MKRNVTAILICSALLSVMGACRHKDLYDDLSLTRDIEVVFDWRNAPEAAPRLMVTHFYNTESGDHTEFIFSNPHGGTVSMPAGSFGAICYNDDSSDRLIFRELEDMGSAYILTSETMSLAGGTALSPALPRLKGTENQKVTLTPDMVWADTSPQITLSPASRHDVITFYPQEIVSHYTVDVINVEDLENLETSTVEATLSGMAEGYYPSRGKQSEHLVSMSFALVADRSNDRLHAEFLTFGDCDDDGHENMLSLYVYLSDGSKKCFNFDVTDQVKDAPDPRNVHIVVGGLKLPRDVSGGISVSPDVKDWETVNIGLKM